jgi:hypothetical protein
MLALLDPATLEPEVLSLPEETRQDGGIWGVAVTSDRVFAVSTRYRPASPDALPEPSRVLVFDRETLTLVDRRELVVGRDVHALHAADDTLYAVSTGTDEILSLPLVGGSVGEERVVWRPDPSGPRVDTHHLNGMTTVGGELVVSGFGQRDGFLWATATDGFVASIGSGTRLASGLRHPHSPLALDDDLVYCVSALRAVRTARGHRSQTLDGYTRGTCRLGDHLYVGTSIGRHVSRSQGVLTNRGEPGETIGRCTVSRLRVNDFAVEATVDLTGVAQEIYDLTPVDDVDRWPRASYVDWVRPALQGARDAYEEVYVGIGWLHTEVAKRDEQVRWLHEEVARRDEQIRWLHAEVARRDATVESLRGETPELHHLVGEHAATIDWLHREVAKRDATIAWLHDEVARREATIGDLRTTMARRDG